MIKTKKLLVICVLFLVTIQLAYAEETAQEMMSEEYIQQFQSGDDVQELTGPEQPEDEVIPLKFGNLIIKKTEKEILPSNPDDRYHGTPIMPSVEMINPELTTEMLNFDSDNSEENEVILSEDIQLSTVDGIYGNSGTALITLQQTRLQYYKLYIDDTLFDEGDIFLNQVTYAADGFLPGEHTVKLEGFADKTLLNEPTIEKTSILNVNASLVNDGTVTVLGHDCIDIGLSIAQRGTYWISLRENANYPLESSEVCLERTAFGLFNAQGENLTISYQNWGRAFFSRYGVPEIKMLLDPGEYTLKLVNRDNLTYDISCSKLEDLDITTTTDIGYDYQLLLNDSTFYWGPKLGNSDGGFIAKMFVNGEVVYTTKEVEELDYGFDINKVGTYDIVVKLYNSADLSLTGAMEVERFTQTLYCYTNKSNDSVIQILTQTISEAQTYYNNFTNTNTVGTNDGDYLLSAYENLSTAITLSQTVLSDPASTRDNLFNANADIVLAKRKLDYSKLTMKNAKVPTGDIKLNYYGKTGINRTVYLKIYNENYQLILSDAIVTDENGDFNKELLFYQPITSFYVVLSAEGSVDTKFFSRDITAPATNTTFDAQNVVTVIVSAKNVTNFANCTFEVYYTPAELAPITFVKDALTPALAVGTYGDIEITEAGDGVVKFKVLNTDIPSGKYFTGVVNMLQFESLQQGTGTVFAKIVTQ